MAGDHAVAGHDLLLHAEVAAAMGDELVDLLEGAGVEQQIDALARRQLAGVVLAAQAVLSAAELGPALQVLESLDHVRPTLRRLCLLPVLQESFEPDVGERMLEHCSITAAGQVQMSAPIRAASTMCIGLRVEATSTSVGNW